MKLASYMTMHNLSEEQMASQIGDVSVSGLRKWLRGERTPRPDQMRMIAEVTGHAVTPNDFILAEAQP
jgi:transcriptional regulator with XRE-family HTH domain